MSETIEVDQRVATAREFVAGVFNGHDAERARDFFTADVAWHGGALGTMVGIDDGRPGPRGVHRRALATSTLPSRT